MSLLQKLLKIQSEVEAFEKDNEIGEGKSAYKAVSSEQVLSVVRPLMNELGLLLQIHVRDAKCTITQTKSGTDRMFTEGWFDMVWIDVESGEKDISPWYAQGVDLAGEKGVGKMFTYAEKYFFMKQFHVPTPGDDPDNSKRTKAGELKEKGTQAQKEKAEALRASIEDIIAQVSEGDPEKVKQSYIFLTKSKDGAYPGVERLEDVSDQAVPVVYSKAKKFYETKTGPPYAEAAKE